MGSLDVMEVFAFESLEEVMMGRLGDGGIDYGGSHDGGELIVIKTR